MSKEVTMNAGQHAMGFLSSIRSSGALLARAEADPILATAELLVESAEKDPAVIASHQAIERLLGRFSLSAKTQAAYERLRSRSESVGSISIAGVADPLVPLLTTSYLRARQVAAENPVTPSTIVQRMQSGVRELDRMLKSEPDFFDHLLSETVATDAPTLTQLLQRSADDIERAIPRLSELGDRMHSIVEKNAPTPTADAEPRTAAAGPVTCVILGYPVAVAACVVAITIAILITITVASK